MARLPRLGDLIVDRRKITEYLLSASHRDGASKARFFASLGFDVDDWRVLADALLQHGREREVVLEIANPFGRKFVVRCEIGCPNGRNPCIDSVWIAEDEAPPRLVTAYPHER